MEQPVEQLVEVKKHMYDSTQIKTYITCPFRYYLRFVNGLVQKDQQIFHLEFGQRVHAMLEAMYLRLKNNQPASTINLDELIGDYQAPEGECDKTREGAIGMSKAYYRKWFASDKKMKILDVEQVRHLDIGGHDFVVKLDTEVEMSDNKYSLEHKTTKLPIRYNYFDNYFLDQQLSAQTAAMKDIYGSCSGVILNILALKMYKRKTKDRAIGLNYEFQRSIIDKTPTEIEDWRINTEKWIDRIEEDKSKGFFNKVLTNTGCMSYNSKCPYANICKCSKGMDVEEQIIENMYDFINPLEYLEN